MPLPLSYYHPSDGVGLTSKQITDNITAKAGGGQALAVQLQTGMNRVTTVGSANDSVVLPAAVPGADPIIVVNAAASNSMNVFPAVGDSINALSANAAFGVAANKVVLFYCTAANPGKWHTLATA